MLRAKHEPIVNTRQPGGNVNRGLISGNRTPARVREFHHRYAAERRQAVIDLISRGIRDGEIGAEVDPELATGALLGAIFYRRLWTGRAFDPDDSGRLVDLVLG